MPTSTIEDNDRLLVRLQAGDTDARQEMIERNMPLVVKCVERLVKKYPKLRKYFDDLIGTGFLALTGAVDQLAKTKLNSEASDAPTGYLKTTIYHDLYEEISQSALVRLSRRTMKRWSVQGREDFPVIQSLGQLQAECLKRGASVDRNLLQVDPGPKHFEMLEDILRYCRNDLEREIILLRAQNLTLEEVGQQIGRKKNTISEILSAIQCRYDSVNLS